MSGWAEKMQNSNDLSAILDRTRKEITTRYQEQQDREQLKREILAECAKMIEQRVNFQIQNSALPQLKELDRILKNLGNL